MNHQVFTSLVLWANSNKPEIERRIQSGIPATTIAAEKKMPVSTMRKALTACGISHGRQAAKPSPLVGDLLTVLARIAKELNVDHKEIAPYL